jgi:putative redox protein
MQNQKRVTTNWTISIYPRSYTDIHIEYVVNGTDLNAAGIQQAIDLSEKKYCGAMASLKARITHTFRMEASQA